MPIDRPSKWGYVLLPLARHLTTAERGWSTQGPPQPGAGKAKPSLDGGRGNNQEDL